MVQDEHFLEEYYASSYALLLSYMAEVSEKAKLEHLSIAEAAKEVAKSLKTWSLESRSLAQAMGTIAYELNGEDSLSAKTFAHYSSYLERASQELDRIVQRQNILSRGGAPVRVGLAGHGTPPGALYDLLQRQVGRHRTTSPPRLALRRPGPSSAPANRRA